MDLSDPEVMNAILITRQPDQPDFTADEAAAYIGKPFLDADGIRQGEIIKAWAASRSIGAIIKLDPGAWDRIISSPTTSFNGEFRNPG